MPLFLCDMVILVIIVLKDDGRYHPQSFLEKALYDEGHGKFFINLVNAFLYF